MQAVKATHVPVLLRVLSLCAGMMVSSWPPEMFQFDPLASSMYILVFSCFSIVQFFWAVTAHLYLYLHLVSRSFFYRLLNRNVDACDLKIDVFARNVKNQPFTEIVFNGFGVELCRFLKALRTVFFLVFWALKTDLTMEGFLVM